MPQFKSGVVVAGHPLASKAGANVLRNGGNAVDAAVTAAHVVGTAAPAFSGVGGGGFALIWLAGEHKAVFVDFRERAPLGANEDMFSLTRSGNVLKQENAVGYRSIAVPGAIAGHASVLEKYGTMRLRETLVQAAKVARRGFRVGKASAYAWRQSARKLGRFQESRLTYLRRGQPYRKGDVVSIPTLAKTLRTIARDGVEEFYGGSIAQKITQDMTAHNGLLTMQDLEDYEPTMREPLRGTYKGYEILTAPPPSAGGAMILQTLNILENLPLENTNANSSSGLHFFAEALSRSALKCRPVISDPRFTAAPIDELVSKSLGKQLAATVSPTHASMTRGMDQPLMPASNTTHLVAIDSERNVASFTESIECYFGSGVTVPGAGFVLNDTMHDFDPHPKRANSPAPGKIPMSSMSPTIVLKNSEPILTLGAAGGPRIISSILRTLLNVIEYRLPLPAAVAAPRIHLDGPRIQLEESIDPKVPVELRRMGHRVEVRKRASREDPGLYFGGIHAAQINDDGTLGGAPDPRRDGLTAGLP